MTTTNDEDIPMGEAGKHPAGPGTGGIAQNMVGGAADALQRSTERGDTDAVGVASTGNAVGAAAPRIDRGGKDAPGTGPGAIGEPTPGDPSGRRHGGGSSGSAGGASAGAGVASAGAAASGSGYAGGAGGGTAIGGSGGAAASAAASADRSAGAGSSSGGIDDAHGVGGGPAGSAHPGHVGDVTGSGSGAEILGPADAKRDEGPLESLGRAISEVVTGPVDDARRDRLADGSSGRD